MFHNPTLLTSAVLHPYATVSTYQGPGDIATAANWKSWFGMRAFRASTPVGTNIVAVRYADTSTVTYVTLANGLGNFSTLASDIATRGGGASPLIEAWYDQTGNANDLTFGGAARPTLKPNAIGPFPSVLFSSGMATTGPDALTLTHPTSFTCVSKNTGTANSMMIGTGVASIGAFFYPAAPDVFYGYAGGAASESLPATANVWHAGQYIVQSGAGNSHTYLDGTDSVIGADVGTGAFSGNVVAVGGQPGTGLYWIGEMMETGVYDGSLFSVRSAMNSNQRTHYGF